MARRVARRVRRLNADQAAHLEALYQHYNDARYVSPDPLEVLADYSDPADREVAGLVSAALAFGNVKTILRSVRFVLGKMERPRDFLEGAGRRDIAVCFKGFQHRYVREAELTAMLWGARRLIGEAGSLGGAFAARCRDDDETVTPGLTRFVRDLCVAGDRPQNYLLPDPAKGSACKRLYLYLRWMVRCDAVDPGGWHRVAPSKLVVPVDTHMHRIARELGLTARKQANLATAEELTMVFRRIVPHDPVRYDFALTRFGIRRDDNWDTFLEGWRRTRRRAA